jgi:hypothetical protein
MNFDDLYPSKFLRASDLAGAPLSVTVGSITRESVGGEQKVIMTFAIGEKSLIVNKTNGKAMAKLFGRDTAEWIGKKITLVPTEVDFKGDLVDAIRIRTTPPARAVPRTAAVEEPPFNDEIAI